MNLAREALLYLSLSAALLLSCASQLLAEESFTVGVSLPLSGALAEYGAAIKNGISLAQQENSELLKEINFIYDDNRYDPKTAVSSFQKLVQFDDVDLMMIWGNEPALSVAPIAEKREVPTIVIAQHEGTSANKNYVIRLINSTGQYSEVLIEYLRRAGNKRFPIVNSELSFFNMLVEGLKEHSRKDEIVEVVDSYSPDQTDFRTTILKLKKQEESLVGLYLLPVQLREFFRQAAELNYKFKAFGATPFESRTVFGDLLPLMEGSLYTHNAITEQFRTNYTKQFGNDIHIAYAANAYQFAVLTAEIVRKNAPFKDSMAIISAYRNTPPGTGPAGDYRVVRAEDGGYYFKFPISVNKVTKESAVAVFTSNLN